ncbi:Scr1 family TA system antitoxin-like transcriptional regulator [Dactylosporangium sp. NPDC005572]|uniref:Scr1 family TA system antitoxin-like transcriptional regulator n=1 Tax=Dactylosporangium sp. NPDC005572 TaxID=3156889 RepID=UPI0033BD8C50
MSEAVAVRMMRQKVLQSKERRFSVVLEEAAVSSRIGSVEMMAAQLGYLTAAGLRESVSLGIVPAHIERTMWSSPGIWMFDDDEVTLETPTAALTITQPRGVQLYGRVFAELSGMAVVGSPARALIMAAIDRLGV